MSQFRFTVCDGKVAVYAGENPSCDFSGETLHVIGVSIWVHPVTGPHQLSHRLDLLWKCF